MLDQHTLKNSNIHLQKHNKYFKNAHYTQKNPQKKITDAPNGDEKIVADDDAADAPNTDDDDTGSTDSKTPSYSLRNCNHAPDASDYDDSSPPDDLPPHSLIYSKLKRKIDPRSTIKWKIKKMLTDVDTIEDNA